MLTLGPVALGHQVYISGKALLPMLQLIHIMPLVINSLRANTQTATQTIDTHIHYCVTKMISKNQVYVAEGCMHLV